MSLAGLGDAETALRLVAGMDADWARVGASISVRFWSALMDRYIGAARAALGTDAARIYAEGFQLSFDEVIRLAMTHLPSLAVHRAG